MAITFVAGLASVGSAMIAAGGLISIGAAFGAFAIGAGLSLVSRALAPSPDLGAQMAGQSVMTRDAAHSRKIVYGRARIGGNVVYLESTGTDNKYLWLVTAIAGHEIDAYEQVWFNDQKVWENGNFTSAWATQGNSATSPYIDIGFYKGDQTTADNNAQRGSASLVENSTKWTDNHKLLGTAYMVVKLTYDQDKFAQGLPNISTVIRGKKVYDAQKDSTSPYYESSLGVSTQRENNSATWQWSQNPALCIRDYLVDVRYGLGESVDNILRSSIDTATDVCNETITLSDTTSQVRYTMDGVIDTGNSIKANIENMTGAMIGRLVYSGGKFELHAGKYVAPTVTIDESMIIGEISVQTKQSRRNAYNGVKGVFLSETDNYILADYPAQISSTYAAQDGDPIYLDMPLPYTVNNIRAQRLAKLALQRSRQQEAITIPCNLNALKFKIGDNISVTNTRLGYSGKVFEVVGYSMGFSSDQMVVNVEAIETAASIWDWATSDEEVFLGAGEVDLYDGTVAIAPASVSVAGDSFLAADGTFSTSFNVSWPDAVDAFTDHYVVEHKLTTASDYFSQQTKSSPFTIIGLQNGQQYNVRLKAVNGIGVSSAYVSATQTAATDTTAPSLPTSITATAGYKSISLVWTNPSEKDFDHVEIHRATTSNGTYVQVSIAKGGFGAKSEHLDGGLADATAFYYKFKSVDRSDNKTSDSDFNGQTPVNATTDAASIDGEDGFNTANVYAYKRSSTAVTDQPSTARTWTFSSGTWNNNDLGNSFTGLIPTGTDDLYVCSAVAKSRQTTDEVIVSDWSPARLFSSNGTNGTNGDDGAAGVRNANGYLYYSLSSTTSPSAPTVSGYNYTTGVFSNISSNGGDTGTWSKTPPDVTSGDAKYWAINYYVTEASYGGTESVDLGSVFASSTFSGLVTFTSLNTALANTGGNITTIDGGLITTDTIAVNKLTGDVTEVYPIRQYYETTLTSTPTQMGAFSLPASELSVPKRNKIDVNVVFEITNQNQIQGAQAAISFIIQKKSKGQNATEVSSSSNKVVVESESIQYQQLISLTGNQIDKIDLVGGVAANDDASGTYEPASIYGLYYDATANKTFIQVAAYQDVFSTGDDLYYDEDKFASSGTWVSPSLTDTIFAPTPIDSDVAYVTATTALSGVGRQTVILPFKMSYGRTSTASNYRVMANTSSPQSGITYTIKRLVGTMENVS
jgi:hypothetical protein